MEIEEAVKIVIREVEEQTNIECMENPQTLAPVFAKSTIAHLTSLLES